MEKTHDFGNPKQFLGTVTAWICNSIHTFFSAISAWAHIVASVQDIEIIEAWFESTIPKNCNQDGCSENRGEK